VIDTTVPGTPGFWMKTLWNQLQAEQRRFKLLEDYYSGRPPLAWGSEDSKARFYRFQQTSRTNFAKLIIKAPSSRCGIRSVATAADHDENGDQVAWQLLRANDAQVHFSDVTRTAFKFGRSFMSVGSPDPEVDSVNAVITAEDPRQVVCSMDPMRPRRVVAAFKLYHDDQAQLDIAILWLPGEKWVATRERKVSSQSQVRNRGLLAMMEPTPVSFSASSFEMRPFEGEPVDDGDDDGGVPDVDDGIFSERYEVRDIPVVPFNYDEGSGRYELHTDLLDRINHLHLQLIVIATLQAFRQRAIEIQSADDMPERDDDGNLIDYNDIFAADPGALWKLPAGATIWESGQVDLMGILQAIKDAILQLAAVTQTPLSMFTPDAATQTAEGASLQREGLVSDVDEFLRGADSSLARVLSLAFKFMGDETRADVSQISVDWLPTERYSLSEQGSAAAQALSSLTWEQIQRIVWQQTPSQIDAAQVQRVADLELAQKYGPPKPAPYVSSTPASSPAPAEDPALPSA